MAYSDRIKSLLTPPERRVFAKLSTPQKVQEYLDSLPINFELSGETYMSPRRLMQAKTAHCFEGALFAAAAEAYHGRKPLLLDLRVADDDGDEDHVVAPFVQNGFWGAISKTNHAILRWRDPVYASVRELAMSYFHEYVADNGTKSLRAYSRPFDLSRITPARWLTAQEDLGWLVDALDDSPHFPTVPQKNRRLLRRADPIEMRALDHEEWQKPKSTSVDH